MRLKVTMEMSGNEYLAMLRKLSKEQAKQVMMSTVSIRNQIEPVEDTGGLFWAACYKLVEDKKR